MIGVVNIIIMWWGIAEEADDDASRELDHRQDQAFMVMGFMVCFTILATVLAILVKEDLKRLKFKNQRQKD